MRVRAGVSRGPTALQTHSSQSPALFGASGMSNTVMLSRQPSAVSLTRALAATRGIHVAAEIRSATIAVRFSPEADSIVVGKR
jgi:hypothetical protein